MKKKISKKRKRSSVATVDEKNIEILYYKATNYIEQARLRIQQTINTEMVKVYWCIGRDIVEEEQKGKRRAQYGTYLLGALSDKLTKKYGKGFSISTLTDLRQFYVTYSKAAIFHALRGELDEGVSPKLGWTHYRALMRVHSATARNFYEIEAEKNCWSGRELERQINSLLFERLAKSKDKKGLMKLARKGQEINVPSDAIKDPLILEFVGIPESHRLVESKLEEALIDNLQHFLLELGKGFALIARQKRLTLDGDHFYADLVFYHAILKCYIIIDIKTKKLTHADLGQMQLYVNYFDKEVVLPGDNPTIGLILCTNKNDAMVKYTLGDKAKQIFASRYQFHLPTEKELEAELKREMREIRSQVSDNKEDK